MRECDNWIEAGMVVRPHGVRGEIVADVKSDLTDLLVRGMEIRLTSRKGGEALRTIEQVRIHQGRPVIQFDGVESRDEAEVLRGSTLWLTREQVGELPEGRYFVEDIIGLAVYCENGEMIGRVEEVLCMPASDIYVVRGEGGEILLPVIDEVVLEIDVEGGRILVHLMEGLRRGA
jgi:16S rRNA processing protein RimM